MLDSPIKWWPLARGYSRSYLSRAQTKRQPKQHESEYCRWCWGHPLWMWQVLPHTFARSIWAGGNWSCCPRIMQAKTTARTYEWWYWVGEAQSIWICSTQELFLPHHFQQAGHRWRYARRNTSWVSKERYNQGWMARWALKISPWGKCKRISSRCWRMLLQTLTCKKRQEFQIVPWL